MQNEGQQAMEHFGQPYLYRNSRVEGAVREQCNHQATMRTLNVTSLRCPGCYHAKIQSPTRLPRPIARAIRIHQLRTSTANRIGTNGHPWEHRGGKYIAILRPKPNRTDRLVLAVFCRCLRRPSQLQVEGLILDDTGSSLLLRCLRWRFCRGIGWWFILCRYLRVHQTVFYSEI